MLGAIAGDIIGGGSRDIQGHRRASNCSTPAVASPTTRFARSLSPMRFSASAISPAASGHLCAGIRTAAMAACSSTGRSPTTRPPMAAGATAHPCVAAVGWLASTEAEALSLAAAQAAVSHDHPDAGAAAQAVALGILLLRQGLSVGHVRERLTRDFGYDLRPERALSRGGFDVSAAGTVPPALTAAFESKDWQGAVRTAVCLGGDADTLACIAGAVAEAIHGVPAEIADRACSHLTKDLRYILDRFDAHLARRSL